MTRKFSRNHSPSVVVPFIAILILLIAAAVLAPTSGAGQPTGKANAVLAPAGTSAFAQAQHPLTPWTDGTERFPVGRSQTKRHGARPMDLIPPSFVPAVVYDSGGYGTSSAAAGDLNGDGKPDLVVANGCNNTNCDSGWEGSVGVLLGNGDGTFQPVVTYDSGGSLAAAVAVGDLNGDGKPDIVVANYQSGTVGILLGNGDGTFQPAVAYGSGGAAASVAVADVNGDGKLDLVVANFWSNTVSVMLGNGDGTFQPAVSYGSAGIYPRSVAVADVKGDGKLDLLVANLRSSAGAGGVLGVLLGNGDGTFQPAVSYASGGTFGDSVAVADVNGDGKPDALVVNESGAVGVLLGNGDGTFQSAVTFPYGGAEDLYHSLAVADVNGDGKPDLLVVAPCAGNNCYNQGEVDVLLGNGDGTFQAARNFSSGGYGASGVAVADVNGDGWPDLLVSNNCSNNNNCGGEGEAAGSVGVLLNNVGAPPTTTTLVSSLNPARTNQNITYTANVTAQDGGALSGSVTFQNGGSTIATVSLTNNQAECSTTYKKGGSYVITATYSGDLHDAVSSATLTEYIESFASKTVVTTSVSPSHVGQPVTFTATVTSKHGATPDGELVTFYDGTTAIGTGTTSGGVATFTTSSLTAKIHTIEATYGGDKTFEPSTGKVKQVVGKDPTTTALSSSLNPSNYGQAVTFTATVTSAGPTPTGHVRFRDGTTVIGSATLSGGIAMLTTSTLAVGTHPITAQYLGDAASATSTSPVLDQVVQ